MKLVRMVENGSEIPAREQKDKKQRYASTNFLRSLDGLAGLEKLATLSVKRKDLGIAARANLKIDSPERTRTASEQVDWNTRKTNSESLAVNPSTKK